MRAVRGELAVPHAVLNSMQVAFAVANADIAASVVRTRKGKRILSETNEKLTEVNAAFAKQHHQHLYRGPRLLNGLGREAGESMNFDPAGIGLGGPLAPAEWAMTLNGENEGEHIHCIADIHNSKMQICRLTLTSTVSEQDARHRLAVKARFWIAEYLSRPHSGATDFGRLE